MPSLLGNKKKHIEIAPNVLQNEIMLNQQQQQIQTINKHKKKNA